MNIEHGIKVRLGDFVEVEVLRIAGVVHEVIEPLTSPAFERRADRQVAQALGGHGQRPATGDEVRPVAMTQRVQTRPLGQTKSAEQE